MEGLEETTVVDVVTGEPAVANTTKLASWPVRDEDMTVLADAIEAGRVISSVCLVVCANTNFGTLFIMDKEGVVGDKDEDTGW